MYDYYIDLFWKIDKILLAALSILSASIVFYAFFKSYFENRRNRYLMSIKKNVHDLAVSGQRPSDITCTVVNTETAQRFLDVQMNRAAVLFNESEQEFIRKCLTRSDKIPRLKDIAERSRNKWRRIEAMLSLGYAEDNASLEILKDSLSDKDEDVGYFSMIALGLVKSLPSAKILLGFLKKDVSNARKIVSILEGFPAGIVDDVGKMLEDRNASIRYWAIKLISKFRPERCIERIAELTSDESADVRAAACECLGKIGKREAKVAVLKCLKDDVWFVRMHAVRALTNILKGECIPELMGLIEDDSWFVKENVRAAMVENIETALPFIKKIMTSEDEIAKKEAVEALEDSGYIIKLLNSILSEKDEEKSRALDLLKVTIKGYTHFGLETALADFDEDSRKKILEAIKSIDKAFAVHVEKRLNQQLNEL